MMRGKTTKPERPAVKITESSGNVFADMGLQNAAELSLKAGLARAINAMIDEQGLTQVQAAKLLHLHQPQVSLLRRGRLGDFSMERLLRCLAILGVEVEFLLHRKPPQRSRTRTITSGKVVGKPSNMNRKTGGC